MYTSDIIREFKAFPNTNDSLSNRLTKFFNNKTENTEISFQFPEHIGKGKYIRTIINKDLEIGCCNIKTKKDIEISTKTEGNVFLLTFCIGQNVEWIESNSKSEIEMNKGEAMLYEVDNITEICNWASNHHYKGFSIMIKPDRFNSFISSPCLNKNIFNLERRDSLKGLIKAFDYAKEYKGKIYLAFFLILLSGIMGVVPFLLTYDIIIKFVEKMRRMPLGNINTKGVGSYKKNLVEDIEAVETLLAHMIPEGIPFVVVPILIYIIIFVTDWRLGFLSLGSIPFGIIPMLLMVKKGTEKMPKYYKSAENMNSAIIEYINGMEVIKVFGRTTDSYKRYKDSVEGYRDFTLDWFKESWTYMAM